MKQAQLRKSAVRAPRTTSRAVVETDASLLGETQIKVGFTTVDVERVSVAAARTDMPGMIRASAETGQAFLIHNAKNPSAATALLINPAALDRRLSTPATKRTLGELIDTLPFKRRGSPRVVVSQPDDHAPTLRIAGQGTATRTGAAKGARLKLANKSGN